MRKHIESTGPRGMDQDWSDPIVKALLPAFWGTLETLSTDQSVL